MNFRRKWKHTQVFLPGEFQGQTCGMQSMGLNIVGHYGRQLAAAAAAAAAIIFITSTSTWLQVKQQGGNTAPPKGDRKLDLLSMAPPIRTRLFPQDDSQMIPRTSSRSITWKLLDIQIPTPSLTVLNQELGRGNSRPCSGAGEILKLQSHCSFIFSFIFISWRLITLQYCSGFCHTLKNAVLD